MGGVSIKIGRGDPRDAVHPNILNSAYLWKGMSQPQPIQYDLTAISLYNVFHPITRIISHREKKVKISLLVFVYFER